VYIHGQLSEQLSGSEAAFKTILEVTDGYQKARTVFLKRVLEGVSQLVNDFIEASTNFILDIFHKRQ
jgi:hypothetical protein